MEKKVLVIIVTYNGEKWIQKCIASVLGSTYRADTLIIDNASTDQTLRLIPDDRSIKVLTSNENLGFGAANNIGFEYALEHGYDYVYLLNQDAYLGENTLGKLIEVHAWKPEFGILSPVQTDANGIADAQFAKKTGIRSVTRIDIPVEVGFVMAAHWLMPVSTIRKVGAFSPTFHHYGEDDNYIDRLHYHGLKAGVITSVAGIHDRGSRVATKEQICRRKVLIPTIKMSNPRNATRWCFFVSTVWLALCSVRNLSMIPLKSIPELRGKKKEIRANMRLSKQEGAFLTKADI